MSNNHSTLATQASSAARLRLAVVSDYDYPGGGVEHFVRELLGLARESCACQLITWSRGCLRPPGFESVEVVEHGDVRGTWRVIEWADVVIVVTSFNLRGLARIASEIIQATRKPLITVIQTSAHSDPTSGPAEMQEGWLQDLLASSRAAVAVSDTVAGGLAPILLRMSDPPPLEVIENGARLLPSEAARRGRSNISFVGRPFPQKGFDLFVRLAEDLHGSGLTFEANTVSVPLDDPSPHIRASFLLGDTEMVEFFDRTDLLVVPYRFADGLPMAVLEALNCGVPVLGLDSPAVTPLLRRYAQPVFPHNYSFLRNAILDWQAGRLAVGGPPPGAVTGWPPQIEQYLRLARTVAAIRHD